MLAIIGMHWISYYQEDDQVREIWVAVGNGPDNANCTTAVNLLDDEFDTDNPMACSTDHSNAAVTIDWAVGAEDMIDNSQDAGYHTGTITAKCPYMILAADIS